MITNAEVKETLIKNFADIRISGITLFINKLIDRGDVIEGLERYRIKNLSTGTRITTLDEFIAAIDPDKLTAEYYRYSDKMTGDRTHPFSVTLDNFSVDLDISMKEDAWFARTAYTGTYKIMFLVNYTSDYDEGLPLKIFEIKLF